MAGVKIAEARHQPVGGHAHGAGDGETLVFEAGAGADLLDRIGDQIEAIAGGAGELLAGFGQPCRPRGTIDQDGADMVFERLQGLRHGGLGDVQGACCLAHRAEPGDGFEGGEKAQGRQTAQLNLQLNSA